MAGKCKIMNNLNKLNDDDRNTLACLLIKAGYTVRLGKIIPEGKRANMYYIEFWESDIYERNTKGE